MPEITTITSLNAQGAGLAETSTGPAAIRFALPGERVTIESGDSKARLIAVEEASPQRVAPFCRHFGLCGGCAMQHASWPLYAEWKRGLVVSALARAGIETEIAPLVDAHGEGRRRVTFHARGQGASLAVGFARAGSHDIVALEECPVLAPSLAAALPAARALAEAFAPAQKPLDIQATATDNGLDIDIRGSGPLPPALAMRLVPLAARLGLARLTRHGETVAALREPLLRVGPVSVTLPPGSFLQATAKGEDEIARTVADFASGAMQVWDLFCGVGPFALRLATARVSVTALDSDGAAVGALAAAAPRVKGRIQALQRDLFRNPVSTREFTKADAVIFDPPRAGAQAQARQLADSRVPRVIAVSCDAQTFARDARILIAGGYRLVKAIPIDQFRHTPHVEIVAQFLRA